MDYSKFGYNLGYGFVIGAVVIIFATIITLPASYVMNRYVYHGTFMRVLLGFIAACGSIFSCIIIFILFVFEYCKPVHYFGLCPTFLYTDVNTDSIFSWLFKVLYIVFEPFILFYTPDDIKEFKKTFQHLILTDKELEEKPRTVTVMDSLNDTEISISLHKGAVNEEVYDLVLKAGGIQQKDMWKTFVDNLSEVCTLIYS